MGKLVNEKDLAEITGQAVQTIRNARHLRRGFPYIRLGGSQRGSIRYDLDDVAKYLDEHRINPEA